MERRVSKLLSLISGALLVLATTAACIRATPGAVQDSRSTRLQVDGLADLDALSLASGEKLKVVATTNIVGDVVGEVGGDAIDLTVLMGIGVDPHSYVPTPADSVAVHNAHVVFANGAGLEADLEEMLGNAGGHALHVYLSDWLELLSVADEHEAGEEGQDHGAVDPHVWFSVPNVIRWVETIEATLSALDPVHTGVYQSNAQDLVAELIALDSWIVGQVALIPEANRKLVTNHPAFGYLANQYGLEQVGAVYPISPSAEPSARDVVALQEAIRKYDVPAVFTESTANSRLAEQVSRDTGVMLVPLYSGSLSALGGGAASYIELMRYDVRAIVEALR